MTRPAWATEDVDHALQLAAYQCRQQLDLLSMQMLARWGEDLQEMSRWLGANIAAREAILAASAGRRRPDPENRIGETPSCNSPA